jgi:hypothetical protein
MAGIVYIVIASDAKQSIAASQAEEWIASSQGSSQ